MKPVILILVIISSSLLDKSNAEIRYFDLGYDFQENVTFFGFKEWSFRRTLHKFDPAPKTLVTAYLFSMGEHGGTHIDAPMHVCKNATTVDQIPLDKLLNLPLVIVDVTEKVKKDSDYAYSVEDLIQWEKHNSVIPEGSVVLVKSGWSSYYPDRVKFTGMQKDNVTGEVTYHYPGFHGDAASFLSRDRKVYGVGTESLSLDPRALTLAGTTHPAHVAFCKHDVWGLEMVRNMDGIPATGTRVSVLPLKAKDGSGGPSRVIVTWNTNNGGVKLGEFRSQLGFVLLYILLSLY